MKFLIAFILCGLLSIVFAACPRHYCSGEQTCCPSELPGSYACCAFEHGICCSDLKHCCPKDHVCDLERGSCVPKMAELVNSSSSFEKRSGDLGNDLEEERKQGHESVVLCDDHVYCAVGSTCCKDPEGSYYCCLHENATCCVHGLSCCPAGAICDSTSLMCMQEE